MSKFRTNKLVSVFLVLSMVIALLVMPMQATFYEYQGGNHSEQFASFQGEGTLYAESNDDISASTYAEGKNLGGVSVYLNFVASLADQSFSVSDSDESNVGAYASVNATDVIESDYIDADRSFESEHRAWNWDNTVSETFYIGKSY